MIDKDLFFSIEQENNTSISDDYAKRFPFNSAEESKEELARIVQGMINLLSLEPSELFPGRELNEDALKEFKEVVKNLNEFAGRNGIGDTEPDLKAKSKKKKGNLLISKIELFDIRCFQHLDIKIKPENQLNYWIMLLGDNAIGKSTILKSVALGLCNESDAAALIKASEMQGDFIRKGATEGYIKIHLCRDSKAKRPKKYTITTKITKKSENTPEIVRQETQPAENFPWADIFVCGYGAYRSKQADTSYEQYKAIDAVKSLFDHQTSLQNPELIALR